jgi:hypothetical protein
MTRFVALASAVWTLVLVLAAAQQPGMGGGPGAGAGGGQPPVPRSSDSGRPGPTASAGCSARGQNSQLPGAGAFSIARPETRTTSIGVAGRLEPSRRIGHTVSIAGFVETIHVSVGDRVTEGQPLVTLSRDAPGEVFRPLVVASRIAGRVSEIHLIKGAEVRSGAAAVTVLDDSEYRLVAALSDKDAFRVAAMGRASCFCPFGRWGCPPGQSCGCCSRAGLHYRSVQRHPAFPGPAGSQDRHGALHGPAR